LHKSPIFFALPPSFPASPAVFIGPAFNASRILSLVFIAPPFVFASTGA
jgi:hypothetical protein